MVPRAVLRRRFSCWKLLSAKDPRMAKRCCLATFASLSWTIFLFYFCFSCSFFFFTLPACWRIQSLPLCAVQAPSVLPQILDRSSFWDILSWFLLLLFPGSPGWIAWFRLVHYLLRLLSYYLLLLLVMSSESKNDIQKLEKSFYHSWKSCGTWDKICQNAKQ